MTIPFGPRNTNFAFPDRKDTISMADLAIIVFVPYGLVVLTSFIVNRNFHDLHHSILGMAQVVLVTLFATEVGKLMAGRPRPDFLDRLDENNDDIWQSFPSGHSSFAFATMLYTAQLIAGKLKTYSTDGAFWKYVITFLFPLASFMVAISRTRDYHHHFSDILGGSVVGIVCSLSLYHLQYHSLFAINSNLPKIRGRFSSLSCVCEECKRNSGVLSVVKN
eukprot:TRINITY_DN1454_c0_g1_i2.p1 TRINITY_DN1454_c0_g1~~TRINITY_DN1454_c0_g1_i2.p1  ORF type:complete len:220 (-),score=46.37 TRINITY_DN1454_c0_g1_i2:67-726(-)